MHDIILFLSEKTVKSLTDLILCLFASDKCIYLSTHCTTPFTRDCGEMKQVKDR